MSSSLPDATRKIAINDAIRRLKASGVWAKRDVVYVLAAHDQSAALINWKVPGTYNLTVGTGIANFVVNAGAQGNGTWSLNTGWSPPDIPTALFVRDNGNVKLYSRSCNADTSDTWYEFGTLQTYMRLGRSSGLLETRMQNSVADTTDVKTSAEMFELNRYNGSNYDVRHNGELVRTVSRGSQALSTGAFNILKQVSDAGRTGRMLSYFAAGSSLSLTESQAENAAIEAYLMSIGATGVYNLDYTSNNSTAVRTRNGNNFRVFRTDPVKSYSMRDLGRGQFRFRVINGDLSASTTRERSELVGADLYPWGTDIWFSFDRIIDHHAPGVHDVICPQIRDDPSSSHNPPFTLSINEQRQECVQTSYKYNDHGQHDVVTVTREEVEMNTWVSWVVHFKAGLATGYSETGRAEVWRKGGGDVDYVKVHDFAGDIGYEDFRGSHKLTNGAPSYDDGNDSDRTIRYRNFRIGTTPLM